MTALFLFGTRPLCECTAGGTADVGEACIEVLDCLPGLDCADMTCRGCVGS